MSTLLKYISHFGRRKHLLSGKNTGFKHFPEINSQSILFHFRGKTDSHEYKVWKCPQTKMIKLFSQILIPGLSLSRVFRPGVTGLCLSVLRLLCHRDSIRQHDPSREVGGIPQEITTS